MATGLQTAQEGQIMEYVLFLGAFLGAIVGAGIASLYVKTKTGVYPWDL